MMQENSTLKTVLYVEDDENDVFFLKRAFKKAAIPNPIHVVGNGEDAMAYLTGTDIYSNRELYPIPSLVVLDLNVPRKSGHEVLEWIRRSVQFQHLPVIVLSSSKQTNDTERAAAAGANGYHVKPTDITKLIELARDFRDSWLTEKI